MTIEQFMRESNWIEGERIDLDGQRKIGILHPNDVQAAECFLANDLTVGSLKDLHFSLSEGRDIKRGNWRDCQVFIGGDEAPRHELLDTYMKQYFERLPDMDAWTAHNTFEKIHPFEDLNGRTGRLIWLHKMGGHTNLSFLHRYYYQTLSNFESSNK